MNTTMETALLSAGLVDESQTSEGQRKAAARAKARRAARQNRDILIKALFSARVGLDKARKGKRSTVAAKAEIGAVQAKLGAAVAKLRGLV